MPVITFANVKGGSGKTTSALILALRLAANNANVTVIDADPEKWLSKWAQKPGKPDNIEVISDVTEESIVDRIIETSQQDGFVLVDLEGTASLMASHAISLSSMVLIPTQGSSMDAESGVKIIRLIQGQGRVLQREIPFHILFTRTGAAMKTRSLKAIKAEFTSAGISTLSTSIDERAPFRELPSFGGTLEALDPKQVASIDKAIINADAFAAEVIDKLKSLQTNTATVESQPEEVPA